jgi:hypothetical protein
MAISTPCYCTREDVKAALDLKETSRSNVLVDNAIEAAARNVEDITNRRFYPEDATRKFDWPNYQRTRPWRLWLNQNDLISVTAVTSGGTSIPVNQVFLEPVNGSSPVSGTPYTYIELDISTSASFSAGATWQRSIAITGTWGYSASTAPAGALAVAMNDTTGTVAQVTDSSQVGVGSLILVGTERMLVTDRSMITTAQAQLSGVSTAVNSDVSLTVTDGTKYAVGEVLLLDSERMLIVDIGGNTLTVKRAWDGSVLATHSGATIYAPRSLTVTRGALGSTAATHLISSAITRYAYPALVVELAIAEAENTILQKTSGYSRTVGEGDSLRLASGAGLADIRARAVAAYGRKARQRAV